MRTAKSRMLGTPSVNVGSRSEGAIENSVSATNVQGRLEFTSVAIKVELSIFQLFFNFSSQVRLWEKGAHREDRRDQPKGVEEVLEEDFEADLDKTVTKDDTIRNFDTIFAVAEKQASRRDKRNTIEQFDEMYNALDITLQDDNISRLAEEENEPNLETISGVGAPSICASTSSGADTNVTDLPDETKIRAQEPQIADTSSQKFACDHCSKTFPSASRLKSHMTKDHKENSSKRFPCPECDWTGKTAGVMKTHIKKKHM